MDKIIIGIDPGARGAIAINWGDSVEVFREFKQSLEDTIRHILRYRENRKVVAYLEKVNAMPGQGVATMFAFGTNYGRCIGALRTAGIAFVEVRPATWQAGLGLPKCVANATKEQKRAFKLQHKKDLVRLAKDLFPNSCKVAEHADALLIMRYGIKNEA